MIRSHTAESLFTFGSQKPGSWTVNAVEEAGRGSGSINLRFSFLFLLEVGNIFPNDQDLS